MAGGAVHEDFRPTRIAAAGATGDADESVVAEVAAEGGVAAEQVGVVFRPHVAAAAPVLVADADVLHLPRLVAAVLAAQVGELAVAVVGHVLDPIAQLFGRAAADVAGDVGLGADLLAEVEELVGAEGVGIDDLAPVHVERVGTVGAGADAVAPVVVVGIAAAGPAEVRDVDRAEGLDDVGPHAAGVGDVRLFADPDAVVDAAAEVLGKLAVEIAADDAAVFVAPDDRVGVKRRGGPGWRNRPETAKGGCGEIQNCNDRSPGNHG